jgi:hypothetical protein
MLGSGFDSRSKLYGEWILEHVCGKDPHKIVGAHLAINAKVDAMGWFGASKYHSTCTGMDFATGYINVKG